MKNYFLIFICLLLAGCAWHGMPSGEHAAGSVSENAMGERYHYQLFSSEDAFGMAEIWHSVSDSALINAKNALRENNLKVAMPYLRSVKNINALSSETQLAYYLVSMEANERTGDLAYGSLARMNIDRFFTNGEEQLKNDRIIWHHLLLLPKEKLASLLARSQSELLRGWLSLALAAKTQANHSRELIRQALDWSVHYPNHPAMVFLSAREKLQNAALHKPLKIIMLLPLKGEFGEAGKAVRDGFIAAFYEDHSGKRPEIKVLDTDQTEAVETLYAQAVSEGAELIIGPLLQRDVERLASHANLTIPVLALNYLSDHHGISNLVQFGVSTEDETEQMAAYVRQKGASGLLLISSRAEWAQRSKEAFIEHWRALNGDVLDTLEFDEQDLASLKQDIPRILHVDPTIKPKQKPRGFKGKWEAEPMRRQDIDGIVLFTNTRQAREINPLLRFYYAGDLPIFGASTVYEGYANAKRDIDLDEVYIADMPWLFIQTGKIQLMRSRLESVWAEHYQRNNRLYGIGMDAYALALAWDRLLLLPNFPLQGVTGLLYLDRDQCVYRQLLLARFSQGYPKLITL